jgi:hypothetical protein
MVAEEYQHAIKFGHQSNRSRWLALRRPIDSIVAYRLKNARLNRFARGEFPGLVLRSIRPWARAKLVVGDALVREQSRVTICHRHLACHIVEEHSPQAICRYPV